MLKKMTNAPLYYALAQVRFNAVLFMEQYVSGIQDSFRKEGYTDFKRAFITTINLFQGGQSVASPQLGSGEPPTPVALQQPRYLFIDETQTNGFLLDHDAITFQTSDYDTFDKFISEFLKGLSIISNAVGLSYSERIGFRVLDAVLPQDGESPYSYLQPTVMGLSKALEPRTLEHSVSETRTRLDNIGLISRTVIFRQEPKGTIAFPPDLQPMPLKLKDKFTSVRGLYAVIDTDGSFEERQKFDVANLGQHLKILHDVIWNSFELTVSKHALEVWE